jgi:hypothetical protein
VIAFAACELPNPIESRKLLTELLTELKGTLPDRFRTHVAGKPAAVFASRGPAPAAASPSMTPGQRVKATIVADPKGKGRPFASFQGLVGNILSVSAGRTLTVGEEVYLVINRVNVASKQIEFRWPS